MSTATTMPLTERDHQGRRRVVVTGVGAVTPVGLTAADTWKGLLVGRSGISLITRFDASVLPT